MESLPVTFQKGVFIQFHCCYYVGKHSIKVVIYEMCVAAVISSFSFFFLFFFFFLLCHLSGREKPGLIISWHTLCSLKNVSCRPVRKLLLWLVSPSSLSPQCPPPPNIRQRPRCILQAGDKGEARRCAERTVAPGPAPSTAAAVCPELCQLLIA